MKRSFDFHGAARLAVAAVLAAALAVGQEPSPQPPPQTPAPSPSPAPSPGPSPGTPGGIPSTPSPVPSPTERTRQPEFPTQRQQEQFPEMQRPVFLSGRVMMEDGTPPPDPVVIERVCNGVPRPEAYTDSKGRFSFQLGQNTSMLADASVSSAADPLDMGRQQQGGAFGRPGRGVSERELMGCELRASLPGFRSDIVSLAGRRVMDNPEVGVIVLRRLGNVEGTTISMTSLQAPKDAKKAYEKGQEAVRRKKWGDALKEFEKAVKVHPNYAAAWFELGMLHERQKNVEQARQAYAESLRSDGKYVKPYLQLAGIFMQERKWQEAADSTSRVLRLNPLDFPAAYFYNSVAHFNLRNLDEAEKSAREALKLDPQHRIPKLEHLLGVILANKADYAGAAEHMKNYIERAPDAADIDTVRKQLVEIEKLLAGRAAAPPQQ
ncbi:MAG: tetratricopeptide repeat protein [Acidobacteria bacterium]|nr:tetratricopeptide repeat protein [Acidobacteriota bacterium]